MQEHELQKIIDTIQKVTENSIEKTVNGKIRAMDEKLSKHIEKLDEHLENDDLWKQSVQPIIDAWTVTNKAGTFVEWLSKKILAIGVIAGVIATAIHFK